MGWTRDKIVNPENDWANPLGIKTGDYVRCWFGDNDGVVRSTTYGGVYKVVNYTVPQNSWDNKQYVQFIDDLGRKNGLAPCWFTLATPQEIVLFGKKDQRVE